MSSIHDGHRARLRARYREEGLRGFKPHEVLELVLTYTRPRGDVNPLAHRLLDTFGSLKTVLEAPVPLLAQVEGMGEDSAILISLLLPVYRQYENSIVDGQRKLDRRDKLTAHCMSLLAGLRNESYCVLCLDSNMCLLGSRVISTGTSSETPVYPRLVAETVIQYNADLVVLCHNHPGGDVYPSREDIASTNAVINMLAEFRVLVVDHIIVGDGLVYSMAAHQDLPMASNACEEYMQPRESKAWDDAYL